MFEFKFPPIKPAQELMSSISKVKKEKLLTSSLLVLPQGGQNRQKRKKHQIYEFLENFDKFLKCCHQNRIIMTKRR
jgi:hypothetical protein